MITGLETESFSIQESVSDEYSVKLKVKSSSSYIIFQKNELEELKELIETCSKYL